MHHVISNNPMDHALIVIWVIVFAIYRVLACKTTLGRGNKFANLLVLFVMGELVYLKMMAFPVVLILINELF